MAAFIPAVIPQTPSSLPRSYCGYRGVPVVPITVQLSNGYALPPEEETGKLYANRWSLSVSWCQAEGC